MASIKIPGVGASTGMSNTLPAGKYVGEINAVNLSRSKQDTGTNIEIKFGILEGPEENRFPTYTRRIFVMDEDHPKAAQYGFIAADEIKSLIMASGAQGVIENDDVNYENLVGSTVAFTLGVTKGKNPQTGAKDGPEENIVRRYEAVTA